MAGKATEELATVRRYGPMLSAFEGVDTCLNEAVTSPFTILTPGYVPVFGAEDFERLTPAVDMYDEGKEIVMKADLPGINKEDLHLDLTAEHVLTLSGERKMEETIEKSGLYRVERSYGSFSRSFELPSSVDTENITASIKDGVLEIRLPKTETAEKTTRNISIN